MASSFKRCAGALVLVAALAEGACSARFVPDLAEAGLDATVQPAPSVDAAIPDTGPGLDAAPAVDAGPLTCTADTFPTPLAIAEASAATVVEMQGTKMLFVIGDSGNQGKGLLVDLTTNATTASQVLLDSTATDDVEAMAFHGDRLYTLTSSGAVREAKAFGTNWVAEGTTYRIGASPNFSCPDLLSSNCAKDYEGLCLRGTPAADGCAGYVASKSEGALYCVTMDTDGHLAVRTTAPIKLGLPANALSDCAFGAQGTPYDQVLLVATNGNERNMIYRVDPASGTKTALPIPSGQSVEAIALDGSGRVYSFGDTDIQTSPARRFSCGPWK